MSAKHVFRPLSTEPPTFGQGVDILAFEKEVQSRLTTKKKVRKVRYNKELGKLIKVMQPKFYSLYPWYRQFGSGKPPHLGGLRIKRTMLLKWIRQQPEYREFLMRMVDLGVKLPPSVRFP